MITKRQIQQFKELEIQFKAIEKEYKEAKKRIIEDLKACDNSSKFAFIEYRNSMRFDQKTFSLDYADLFEKYKRPSTSEHLQLLIK